MRSSFVQIEKKQRLVYEPAADKTVFRTRTLPGRESGLQSLGLRQILGIMTLDPRMETSV